MTDDSRCQELKQRAANGDASALAELKDVAEEAGGNPEALFLLGFLFDESSGTKISSDSVSARQYYLGAAQLGHSLAQMCVGNMIEYGEGGDKNLIDARRWYEAAAHQGQQTAQMNLGRMLQTGRGGPADKEEAARWYFLAAKQGDEWAATNLAFMHLHGELRDPDIELAGKLLQLSAEKLDGVAHLYLGELFSQGRHVERHPPKALLHYCISALLLASGENHDLAVQRKDEILKQLPDLRRSYEETALKYISERNGRLPT